MGVVSSISTAVVWLATVVAASVVVTASVVVGGGCVEVIIAGGPGLQLGTAQG